MTSNHPLNVYIYSHRQFPLSVWTRQTSLGSEHQCRDFQLPQVLRTGDSGVPVPDKVFHTTPLKPREHHGKGSRKNIRTGKWIEGLWKSIFWEWHGHCNEELTADTCVTVQLPALAKTRLALSIISHRSGRDTYTSLLSCGPLISGMGLIAFSCVLLLSSLSSSICFQTCGHTGGPD